MKEDIMNDMKEENWRVWFRIGDGLKKPQRGTDFSPIET